MNLAEYLQANGLSEAEFAEKIETSQSAVNRYCGERVPQRDVMRKIIQVTGGLVTPNDWYRSELLAAGAVQ